MCQMGYFSGHIAFQPERRREANSPARSTRL
jgi:hypothetical protein